MPVQRIRSGIEHMGYLCSGFEHFGGGGGAKVSKCHACAMRLSDFGAGGGLSGALVKHAFSSKVSVLPGREHRLFENRLGGVPLSDFAVTLHFQCNLTEW